MRNLSFGLRRLLSLIVGLTLWAAAAWPAAAEPSAAGLWQKIENGEPQLYVLVVDHNGVFEGLMAKLFPQAGQYRSADLFGVPRRPQERALARYPPSSAT